VARRSLACLLVCRGVVARVITGRSVAISETAVLVHPGPPVSGSRAVRRRRGGALGEEVIDPAPGEPVGVLLSEHVGATGVRLGPEGIGFLPGVRPLALQSGESVGEGFEVGA